jgi:hypothetical protein
LITGIFRKADGETGNIYQADRGDQPNTSNLAMPTPWTSSGIGSAIPASELGSMVIMNTSSLPHLPSQSTSATDTSGSMLAATTSALGPVNATNQSGETAAATPSKSMPDIIETAPPTITPPIRGSGTLLASHGSWILTMLVVVVTLLLSYKS